MSFGKTVLTVLLVLAVLAGIGYGFMSFIDGMAQHPF